VLARPWLSALLGLVGGVAVSVGLGLAGLLPSSSVRPAPVPSAADAFLSRWRAHLEASWSVQEVEERTTGAGARLRVAVHEAQRPPDSVRLGLGSVDGRRGSTVIACATAAGGDQPACRSAPAPGGWQETVDRQMAGLRRDLTGPEPVYVVQADGTDCFRFVVRDPTAALPVTFGRGARYCLDPVTAALLLSRVERAGAVDTITAIEHHAPATDADLAFPSGLSAPPLS